MEIMKPKEKALYLTLVTLCGLSTPVFATPKLITTRDLLTNLSPTEPWRKGILTAAKTINFQQTASGSTDATTVSKIKLAYFTSANCTGAKAGNGFYQTPNGTSFSIGVGNVFGLVAASTWSVGTNQLAITDMTTINSVAVTLQSTNNDVPQSNFSGSSFSCAPVSCATNACTSVSGTQTFELKTIAAVGDPADGGVIADTSGLIATKENDSTGIVWGGQGIAIGATAQSHTDGAGNTVAIVAVLGAGSSYAAGLCDELAITGGYTSNWFLPAIDQLNALYTNQAVIGGFPPAIDEIKYYSSTESTVAPTHVVWTQNFGTGIQENGIGKANSLYVRCVRSFIPA